MKLRNIVMKFDVVNFFSDSLYSVFTVTMFFDQTVKSFFKNSTINQEKVDTLTAASTVVTPSQNVAPNENFLQHQTITTATSIMGHQQQINNNTVSGSISMPLTPASSTTPLGKALYIGLADLTIPIQRQGLC